MLLVVAVVLSASGCAGRNSGDSVAVIGDSITSFDQPDLEHQLGHDFHLTISGNFGEQVAEVLPEAKVIATTHEDQVIINLGTNDVLGGVLIPRSMVAMQEMIDMFPNARCIHLVNLNEHMLDVRTGRSVSEEAREFNAALGDLVKGDDRLGIIDWNAVAASSMNDRDPAFSTLTKDSVHPTAEGNDKLNSLYANALHGCGSPLGF